MNSAFEWKQFYAAERAAIGCTAIARLLDESSSAALSPEGALIIPHTRLEVTGRQMASAVNAVIESGADRVLALGVVHGARRCDEALVAAAKAGDGVARRMLRGIHDESGYAAEEFSLDAFTEMVELAAQRAGRSIDVVRRYPFLVGDDPDSLPGLDDVRELVEDGCALVATTDPLHHGVGYGVGVGDCRSDSDPATLGWTRVTIETELSALSDHRFDDFQQLTAADRSDFRDTGPVLALLLGRSFTWSIDDLALVDYSITLNTPAPTWVAGALITAKRARPADRGC